MTRQKKGWHQDNLHEKIIKLIPLVRKEKNKILDLGAGRGEFSEILKSRGWNVSACDKFHKNFKPKKIVCKYADVNQKIPYKDNTFDFVVANDVIEHIENPWQMMREIYRILKKNGLALIVTPNPEHWLSRITFFFRGTLRSFRASSFKYSGHITPIFSWSFKQIIQDKFQILRTEYTRNRIPIVRIDLPWKNRFFGEEYIFIIQKNQDKKNKKITVVYE